jgi:hypothetical protein
MGGGVEATWQRNSFKLIKIGKSEERQALGLYDVRRMNDARLIDIKLLYFTFKTAVTLSVTKEGLELPDDDEETKKRESDKAKFDALAW